MTDEQLAKMCLEFRQGVLDNDSPDGMCMFVSTMLAGYLRTIHGLQVKVRKSDHTTNVDSEWYEHHWIELPDGRVLDPTYDQFKENVPIYIGERTEFHR